jgi:hypothetical protein
MVFGARSLETERRRMAPPIATACLAVAAGLTSVFEWAPRGALIGALVIAGGLWIAWAVSHWRWTARALLLVLPFAALPGLVLGAQGWPTLLKDFLFVLPAYAGAIPAIWRAPARAWLPRPLLIVLAGLVGVVFVDAVRTVFSGGVVVATIGLKTWLLYVPLLTLPRLIFRRSSEVLRWTRLLIFIATIPAAIGILEAVLIYSGHESLVYASYGNLAEAVTQNFVGVGPSDDFSIKRIPSTFTFVFQYYLFLLTVFPIAVGVTLGTLARRSRMLVGGATFLIALGGVTCGARGFLAWLPVEIVLLALLAPRYRGWIPAVAGVGVVSAALILGDRLVQAFELIVSLVYNYAGPTGVQQWSTAFDAGGLLGVGVGMGTGAARYVVDDLGALGPGVEAWYAKVLYEVGVPGLVLVVLLWGLVLVGLWRARSRLRPGPTRSLSDGILVMALVSVLNLYKGPFLDLDPLNVYFWFLVGLGLSLPSLAASPAAVSGAALLERAVVNEGRR